jgi:hypothetical protein
VSVLLELAEQLTAAHWRQQVGVVEAQLKECEEELRRTMDDREHWQRSAAYWQDQLELSAAELRWAQERITYWRNQAGMFEAMLEATGTSEETGPDITVLVSDGEVQIDGEDDEDDDEDECDLCGAGPCKFEV